jgi:hypothetical protein
MADFKAAHPPPVNAPQGSDAYADWARANQVEYNRLHSPSKQTREADPTDPNKVTITGEDGSKKTLNFTHGIDTPMDDENLGRKPVTGETGS